MTTIVTNCSKRKRLRPNVILLAGSLEVGSLEAVAREWDERVAMSEPLIEAGRLYSGRQFNGALQAKSSLNAELLIVSAGLGVLLPSDPVASYNLTVTPGSDSILARVKDDITPSDWWQALTARPDRFRALGAMLTQASDGPLLIAMSSPYLAMVEHELEQFSARDRSRTRIFTGPSFRFRDARLNQALMPYDGRLDGPDSPSPGTATDFASRALRDFATVILPTLPDAGCEEHANAVLRRLVRWRAAVRPERERRSDSELMDVIRVNWSEAGASASQMLRRVRSALGLACEQRRMRHLYATIQKEMEEAP